MLESRGDGGVPRPQGHGAFYFSETLTAFRAAKNREGAWRFMAWLMDDEPNQPNYGAINDVLFKLGLMREPVAWLSDPALAMPAVVLTNVWRGVPYLAALARAVAARVRFAG